MVDSLREIFDIIHNTPQTALGDHNARALMDFARDLTQHYQLPATPEFILAEHSLPMATGGFAIGMGGVQPRIRITRGALEKVFDAPNLNTHVPDGLKSVIAHEFSHIADGPGNMLMGRVPLFAVPIASLVAFELFKAAKKRHEVDPLTPLDEQLRAIMVEEQAKSAACGCEHRGEREKHLLEWGGRLAAVGGGLVVGGMISKHMSLASEFKADRMGVLATGNPEAFIQTLDRFGKSIHEVTAPQVQEWQQKLSQRDFMGKIGEIYGVAKEWVETVTYHAHPSDVERYAAIRKLGAEHGLASAYAASPVR